MVGFLREIAVNGDMRAVREQRINGFVETCVLAFCDLEEIGVVCMDFHANGLSDSTNGLGNSAKTDETECFSGEF